MIAWAVYSGKVNPEASDGVRDRDLRYTTQRAQLAR
jgi:hypothetical protein